MRVFWQTLGESLRIQQSLDAVLAELRRHASLLGATAREIEGRSYDR